MKKLSEKRLRCSYMFRTSLGVKKICEYVIMKGGHWVFPDVPNEFKTQEMCKYVVREDPDMFGFVPDR